MITKCNLLSLVPSEATFHPTPPLQKRKLMWQCHTIVLFSWIKSDYWFLESFSLSWYTALYHGSGSIWCGIVKHKLKPPCKIRDHMREQFMGACFPKSIKTRKKKGSINHSVYNIILDKWLLGTDETRSLFFFGDSFWIPQKISNLCPRPHIIKS